MEHAAYRIREVQVAYRTVNRWRVGQRYPGTRGRITKRCRSRSIERRRTAACRVATAAGAARPHARPRRVRGAAGDPHPRYAAGERYSEGGPQGCGRCQRIGGRCDCSRRDCGRGDGGGCDSCRRGGSRHHSCRRDGGWRDSGDGDGRIEDCGRTYEIMLSTMSRSLCVSVFSNFFTLLMLCGSLYDENNCASSISEVRGLSRGGLNAMTLSTVTP